jgi:Fe-S cluster assembly protein SufD
MTQVAEKLQPWLGALDERPTGGPRWLQDLRERGASRFAALGFPSVREEEWRFTPVTPIASGEFHLAPAGPALTESDLAGYVYGDAVNRIVIVNGRYSPELSRTPGLPPGMRVGSLSAAVTERADDVARFLGRLAEFDTRPFTALNTAFVDDGAFVQIPDKAILEAPIQVLFLTTGEAGSADAPSSEPAIMAHPRVLIVAGDGSQSRIVETYVGPRGAGYFANGVTEVFVGENAVVDHYKVQEESTRAFHVASMHVHLTRSSTFSSHSFTLGGKLVRNEVIATMDGEGAECTLNGLYVADGDRLVDNHTTIDHAKAHCPSHEVYKGILGGRARAVFNGKIIVRPDAQKTDAKQTNRALLLTDNASINTKPQLEIFADDVKCTHGAAIGQLDDDAIFYLRARGLTFFEARDMLIHAFAGEILDRVRVEPLRVALEAELYAQLAKDLAEMDGV